MRTAFTARAPGRRDRTQGKAPTGRHPSASSSSPFEQTVVTAHQRLAHG
jgi:hypothetical protein